VPLIIQWPDKAKAGLVVDEPVISNDLYPTCLAVCGLPDASTSCGRRSNTIVAPQALALLNDPFLRVRAVDFAKRILSERGLDRATWIAECLKLAIGRAPSDSELRASLDFLENQMAKRLVKHPNASEDENRLQALETPRVSRGDLSIGVLGFCHRRIKEHNFVPRVTLTYLHNGRRYRLTDVAENILSKILSTVVFRVLRVTIYRSQDDGKIWPHRKTIFHGPSA
jgi:hypothetical protein